MINFEQKIAFRDRSSELAMKFELADVMVELSEIAQSEGILSLKDLLGDFLDAVKKNPKDVDFKLMVILLKMYLDDFDIDTVRHIGENYIDSNTTDLERRLILIESSTSKILKLQQFLKMK